LIDLAAASGEPEPPDTDLYPVFRARRKKLREHKSVSRVPVASNG
jgi:hypothetical protein